MTTCATPVHVPLVAPPRATLAAPRPLVWRRAPARATDVAPLVRAGSALRRWNDRWIVVQDDVRALAVVDSLGLQEARTDARDVAVHAEPLLLPVGDGGERTFDDVRGNKAGKLDLEAAVALPDGRLLVLGSGSSPTRERCVLVAPPGHVRIVAADALYARLRDGARLHARELNLEGAVVIAGRLRLFHRAVGRVGELASAADTRSAARVGAANATLDLDLAAFLAWLDADAAPPHVTNVVRYDLGCAENAVIGFTDAALQPDGTIAFLACAELTGDPTVDGRVTATRFGVLDGAAGWQSEIVHEHGGRVLDKLEGIEPAGRAGCFHVVSDPDDPATPAGIGRLMADLAVRG